MCLGKLTKFWAKAVKRLDWKDIALIKISVAAFVLGAAKLWAPLLSLELYWYVIIFVVAAIRPVHRAYFK